MKPSILICPELSVIKILKKVFLVFNIQKTVLTFLIGLYFGLRWTSASTITNLPSINLIGGGWIQPTEGPTGVAIFTVGTTILNLLSYRF